MLNFLIFAVILTASPQATFAERWPFTNWTRPAYVGADPRLGIATDHRRSAPDIAPTKTGPQNYLTFA
jgi:hypothetical protein